MAFILGVAPLSLRTNPRRAVSRCRWIMVEEKQGEQQQRRQQETKPKKKKRPPLKSNATWDNVGHPDVGTKGLGSIPGWDMRPKSKREKGAGVCDWCKGTGYQICTMCYGVDYRGIDGEIIECPGCQGKRKFVCTTCYGTTEQVELKGKWWGKGRGILSLFQKKV